MLPVSVSTMVAGVVPSAENEEELTSGAGVMACPSSWWRSSLSPVPSQLTLAHPGELALCFSFAKLSLPLSLSFWSFNNCR